MIPVIFLWKFCQIITQKQRKTAHFKETSSLTWYARCDLNAWPLESERCYVRCLHRSDY